MEPGGRDVRMKNLVMGSGPSDGHAFHSPKDRFSKARAPVHLTVGHILLGALVASALLWVGFAEVLKAAAGLLS
jgi:hypothetical protein